MYLLGDYHKQISGIYNEYHQLIISVALRVYRDVFYAQDVLQDTMLKISQRSVLNRISCMNNSQHIKNYISKVARCKAIDRYQELAQEKDIISLEHCYDSVGMNNIWVNYYDYETSLEVRERIKLIIECIEGLPDIYSQILRLKVFEGIDTHIIAKMYGITDSTVRKRLQRARELLRDKLVEVCVISEEEYNRLGY